MYADFWLKRSYVELTTTRKPTDGTICGGCSAPALAPAPISSPVATNPCHTAPEGGLLAYAAVLTSFPVGRASRHVRRLTCSVDGCSSNRAPALAEVQPVPRHQAVPKQRENQGQCQRQAP